MNVDSFVASLLRYLVLIVFSPFGWFEFYFCGNLEYSHYLRPAFLDTPLPYPLS
jgi:hypothetical protein